VFLQWTKPLSKGTKRNVCGAFSTCFVALAAALAQGPVSEVSITTAPSVPLIERRDHLQTLNFDLIVSNRGKSPLRLTEIELSVFDSSDRLVVRKTANSDGLSPGIEIVAKPLLAPGETMDVFNPFYFFDEGVSLHRLDFVFRYLREDNEQQRERNRHRLPMDYDIETRATVTPQNYLPKTNLILPLSGRIYIWEGHDFYAHHRRVPLHAPNVQKLGIHANANRYASDMVIVDERGNMYHDDPYIKKNWYTYGATIYAPGAGTVAGSANNLPDNEFQGKHINTPNLSAGADPDLGNYVLIDHGNAEFSIFPHMMSGSVRVKTGQAVRQGEIIGQVGFSGDVIFPHVHYSLLTGPNIYHSDGLPAYFSRFRRLLGQKSVAIEQGTVDSGDFLESDAEHQPGQSR
jgi:murein DD-endopeptidase MepM/ murein hydrolase activator NlpD